MNHRDDMRGNVWLDVSDGFLFLLCFQVPDDEVTEISEATEATDATDISEASDQDNNKKASTHLPPLVLSHKHT